MARIFEFEGVEYELPDDATVEDFEEYIASKESSARSEALGGPFPTAAEQELIDYRAFEAARKRAFAERVTRPPVLPPLPEPDVVTPIMRERERVSAVGGEAEEPYLEAREGVVPILRPTRIETIMVDGTPQRVIREYDPTTKAPVVRAPTATEEMIEAYARQPVMTREAAARLAAGEDPATVDRTVGGLEGAVLESPFQAAFRGIVTPVEAAAVEAYSRLPFDRTKPVPLTLAGIGAEIARAAGDTFKADVIEGAASAISPFMLPVRGARAAAAGLKSVGLPVPKEFEERLDAIGYGLPVIPAPAALPEKTVAQRIREGESVADAIRSDPATVEAYTAEYGVLAPLAIEAAGMSLSMPLPLTPVGVVSALPGPSVAKAVSRAATGALTKKAVQRAENMLAAQIFTEATRQQPTRPLALDDLANAIPAALGAPPAVRAQALRQFAPGLDGAVARARADLARVAPRTDLIRVSPSYAVPRRLAGAAVEASARQVSEAREALRLRGEDLPRGIETAIRDDAVRRVAAAEARRLDTLGQFQVLLDGLDSPRAWDTTLVRAARAAASPAQALKRAAVTAAEQEVARTGQSVIRGLRREIEAAARKGEYLPRIIMGIGRRELAGMPEKEVARKVLEEAYGGERAAAIYARIKDRRYDRIDLLNPDVARELHDLLVQAGAVPSALSPAFEANALKIIIEEGTRRRVTTDALARFAAQYPDIQRPTLAMPGKLGTVEERAFFENGAESLFRLADSLPTRAAGELAPSIEAGLEQIAAAARSVRSKVRVPLVAEATLLAGELFAAPVRAFVATRFGLPMHSDIVGATTPWGYLRPEAIQRMIDDLGGFGPSRMDLARKGSMVRDILLFAQRGATAGALDAALGRPYAYATVDAIEEAARRGVFVQALREGRTPEAAIELARRSQYDYGSAQDFAVIQALAPFWAGAVTAMAAGREFLDGVARNPGLYGRYLRALQAQQRAADPDREAGDATLRRAALAGPTDVLGRPVIALGPAAPLLAPIDAVVGLARMAQAAADVGEVLSEGRLIRAALEGSTEALDRLASRAASISAALQGGDTAQPKTVRRTGAGPTAEQTYMSVLAAARALDPDPQGSLHRATLDFLAPRAVPPPKGKRLYTYEGATAWSEPPEATPSTYVYAVEEQMPGTDRSVTAYYVLQPSPLGRQRLQAVRELPFSELAGLPLRVAGTALESGVAEALLWTTGAETIETPTRRVVEQARIPEP